MTLPMSASMSGITVASVSGFQINDLGILHGRLVGSRRALPKFATQMKSERTVHCYIVEFVGTVGWARTTDLLFHRQFLLGITTIQRQTLCSAKPS